MPEAKINQIIDHSININDYLLLDALWIFSYSIPSKSGYHQNKQEFKKWISKVIARNLQKKYEFDLNEIKKRIRILSDFLNTMPDFLSYNTFNEDDKLFKDTLFNKSSKILSQNVKNKLKYLSELDKKILSFILSYMPIKIQDSVKQAEKEKKENLYFKGNYSNLPDFNIQLINDDTEIDYFEIDPKEWTYIFNQIFNEELKEEKFKEKIVKKIPRVLVLLEEFKEYSFWQMGDELVKMGIAYWTFSISAKGNVTIYLIIPNFVYESIVNYKDDLPVIENIIDKIEKISMEKQNNNFEKEWDLEGLLEKEKSKVSEIEIEKSIISRPELIEEGLEFIGNQYRTSVGNIDILCRDKNGNYVVIEIKREKGSYKVVGQIQKYMTWIMENVANDKQVRGIIVVSESDKELEYSIKGSKFSIEIKTFGQAPPIEQNIKYCERCGKLNKKSANYCVICGNEFYM